MLKNDTLKNGLNLKCLEMTESLEMTSELGIPVSVTSNPEAGRLALNMDIQACM